MDNEVCQINENKENEKPDFASMSASSQVLYIIKNVFFLCWETFDIRSIHLVFNEILINC